MHESFFSHKIARPYPYRWFTPVVIVAGLAAVVLVSFINFTTSGYELVAISSSNPNKTVAEANRFGNIKWPEYFVQNSQATCASTTLSLGSFIYTTNNALRYKLLSVWREIDGVQDYLGSLVYHNNLLRNCNVTEVDIQVLNKYSQRPVLSARASVGVLISSTARCAVDTDTSVDSSSGGQTFFELQGTYQDGEITDFLSDNATTKASLYWGHSLLGSYWKLFSKAWHDSAHQIKDGGYFGEIILARNASDSVKGTKEEVMSNSFFHVECYTENGFCANHSIPILLSSGGPYTAPYPDIWNRVDTLGKTMWFTTMTDLGLNDTLNGIPNMLAYGDLLQNLTSNFTNEAQAYERGLKQDQEHYGINLSVYAANQERESYNASSGPPQPPLGAAPSYLSTNYICQVPRKKSSGTLFFSVLIADLVLLQALWTAFKFVVDTIAERRHPSMAYCAGCLQIQEGGALPARPRLTVMHRHPSFKEAPSESHERLVDADSVEVGRG
ncbi:hypothetical protein F5Y17DRAFT_418971 [Xylariaceae sp. FL0594]|nr:hypothetical protein F5Y17DRAFT_418971 [Xylariaceae sp. FL0594]